MKHWGTYCWTGGWEWIETGPVGGTEKVGWWGHGDMTGRAEHTHSWMVQQELIVGQDVPL